MSSLVPIVAVPNQSFSIQLEDVRYALRFMDLNNMMSVDITIDDEIVVLGHRVVGGAPLIPYEYLEGNGGNFIFNTELGDLVYWEQFETNQQLIYFTAAEMEAIRGN